MSNPKSKDETKHLGARVPVTMWDALKEAADKEYITLTQLVRRLAREFLASQKKSK